VLYPATVRVLIARLEHSGPALATHVPAATGGVLAKRPKVDGHLAVSGQEWPFVVLAELRLLGGLGI